MAPTAPEPGDEGAPGFFQRNRVPRIVAGVVITAVLIAAYAFGALSYRAGLTSSMPDQQPPATRPEYPDARATGTVPRLEASAVEER